MTWTGGVADFDENAMNHDSREGEATAERCIAQSIVGSAVASPSHFDKHPRLHPCGLAVS